MQKNSAQRAPVPTESVEQQLLFRWARFYVSKYPELALLYHIPNGGSRRKSEAGRFKAEGVKAGVPDLFLPAARGNFHGLYIEMKRKAGGRVSADQKVWIDALSKQGYAVRVCLGWEDAARTLEFLSTPSGWRATAKTDKVFICFCAKGRRICLFKTRKEKNLPVAF